MNFDFDIDTKTSFNPIDVFSCIKASMVNDKSQLVPHPCGVYFQNIPIDELTKNSAIPYKEAGDIGFMKFDFLHVNVYDNFQSREEIKELLKIDPDWNLLKLESVVLKLFQISKHYEIVKQLKIKSIEDLADLLALIRPQKRFLLKKYIENKASTRKLLYVNDSSDSYSFKKGHAIAYAMIVVLQLHLEKI